MRLNEDTDDLIHGSASRSQEEGSVSELRCFTRKYLTGVVSRNAFTRGPCVRRLRYWLAVFQRAYTMATAADMWHVVSRARLTCHIPSSMREVKRLWSCLTCSGC